MFSSAIFMGAAGAAFAGIIAFFLKEFPQKLLEFIIHMFTTKIVIRNDDDAFIYFSEWLSTLVKDTNVRELQLFEKKDTGEWSMTIGPGSHLFWHNGIPFLVKREIMEKESTNSIKETFTITFLGRSALNIINLIKTVVGVKADIEKTKIYTYSYWWQMAGSRDSRSIDSVIINKDQLNGILSSIDKFMNSKDLYKQRGIPYKLNVLFTGEPGTGKTSLIMAIAAHLKRSVYFINLQSMDDDEKLLYAVSNVPRDAVILIEDIDAVDCTSKRENSSVQNTTGTLVAKSSNTKVSLSCLLNILDGVLAHEGRMLFMTTNYEDKLDSAILRSGRVDIKEYIGMLHHDEIRRFYLKFFDNNDNALKFADIVQTASGADLQKHLLTYVDNEQLCIHNAHLIRDKEEIVND